MKIEPNKSYAVITGDIVGSTSLPPEAFARLHDVIRQGVKVLRKVYREALPLDVDIFSGDSWQLLIARPGLALRVALYLRAHLLANIKGADTRMAVAIGSVDTIPGKRVSEGDGEACRLSGRLLEEKSRSSRLRFVAGRQFSGGGVWDASFHILDALIVREWTGKRAQAMIGALQGLQQEQIARLWEPPIRQQAVTKHLRGAGWDAIQVVLKEFERSFQEESARDAKRMPLGEIQPNKVVNPKNNPDRL